MGGNIPGGNFQGINFPGADFIKTLRHSWGRLLNKKKQEY